MKILHIGCGKRQYDNKEDEVINLDLVKLPGVDKVWDLNKGVPYPDNTFDKIIAEAVLEHLNDMLHIMEEVHRTLKPGGVIIIRVPSFAGVVMSDPTHKQCHFSYHYFDYWTESGERESHMNYFTKVRFKILKKKIVFGKLHTLMGISFLMNMIPNIYENFFVYLFPPRELYFELQAVKKK